MTAVQNNTITAVRINLTGLGTFGFLLADEVSSAISSKTNSKIISILLPFFQKLTNRDDKVSYKSRR